MSTIPSKVLVTGGCGFLGSNIAAHYLGKGSEVVVFDALFRTGAASNLAWLQQQAPEGALTHIHEDLADPDAASRAFQNHGPFDYVCHLAGQVAMTTSLSDPRRDMLTNVVGTFNLLEAMRAYSPDALLAYSSTNKVYGDLEDLAYAETESRYVMADFPSGLSESLRLDFASPYGCSKGAADQYVHDWYRNYGLKTVVFRHSSIYGGRQFSTIDQGWIGWFCSKALEQRDARAAGRPPEPFTLAGSGKQVRDVLHAEDLIRLYDSAYQRRDAIAGECFNIGGGVLNSLSLLELFSLLAELTYQPPLEFSRLPPRQSDQKVFIASVEKAERLLGWKPQVQARDGIARMLKWLVRDEN